MKKPKKRRRTPRNRPRLAMLNRRKKTKLRHILIRRKRNPIKLNLKKRLMKK